MKRRDPARNLATSVSSAVWSRKTVERALYRRLPDPLRDKARALALGLLSDLPSLYAPSPAIVAENLETHPGFEVIWRFCRFHNVWPSPDLAPPHMAPVDSLADLGLPDLPTVEALGDWLLLSPERLEYLADPFDRFEAHDEMAVNHYHYHLKLKSGGGVRLVEAPKPTLKAMQRFVLRGILDVVPPHQDAFGFVKGRNCLQAAGRHAGEEAVLRFDLLNFFPSIKAGRIFGFFRCLGYPHGVSRMLTAITTTTTPPRVLARMSAADRQSYRNSHLPQGAPTSPALANLICHRLDRRLSGLAARVGANYSRYADDLTFSGDRNIRGVLLKTVPEITEDEGFRLNTAKTKDMSQTSRQKVTGIVVNRHLNVDRRSFDRLKAVIHACGDSADLRLRDAAFRASLLGQIGWVEAVNPARGQKLRRLLAKSWDRRFLG